MERDKRRDGHHLEHHDCNRDPRIRHERGRRTTDPVITVHRLLRASGPLANQTTTATSRLRPATKALDSTEKSGPAPKYASASPAGIPDQISAFRTTFARRASAAVAVAIAAIVPDVNSAEGRGADTQAS